MQRQRANRTRLRRRVPSAWTAILVAVVLSGVGTVLVSCSSSRDRREGITIGSFAQPDLDPAFGFNIPSGAPLSQVYLPLLTYKRVEGREGTTLIPGLAEELPDLSSDGRTYTLRLRKGLVYSDGRPVKASDFEHEMQRLLNRGSPGAFLYERIVGAAEYEKRGDPDGDIAGIETDDRTRRITIRLDRPYAPLENVLALPFATPVPANTPFRDMTVHPPPGTGPFEIAKSEPNRQYVLERSRQFDSLGIEGVPPAKVDRITVKIIQSKAKQAEDVLSGKLDYMLDSPPPDLLPTVRKRAGDRYEQHDTLNTNWLYLNDRLPPFNDPRVREAVNYGVDKSALGRIYAGDLREGCSFLPPGMPGYDKTLDKRGCPFGDPARPPDVARARRLVRAAGADGAKVTVWGFDQVPASDVAQAYTEMLNQIGLDAELKLVDFEVWRPTIGNEKTKAQTGVDGLSPPQTFPHPLAFFALVDGDSIRPTNNKNTSNVDDPHINRELDRLEPKALDAATGDWAELNRYLVRKAYLVPYGHRIRGTLVSNRIDFENCTVFHPIYLEDWSQFCLKEGEG
jgi:peptide/nickel transport system substrate-binding protein